MLEEVFRCESDQKIEIPNLKAVLFDELPSLCQEIEFHTVKDRLVENCPKLSLTSMTTYEGINKIFSSMEGFDDVLQAIILSSYDDDDDLSKDRTTQETSNQNPTTKPTETEVQETSGSELTSQQVNTNQSLHASIAECNHHENGIESNNQFISLETQTKETLEAEQEFVEKVPGIEIQAVSISPTNSELIRRPCQNPSDMPLNRTHSHEIKRSVEEGATSVYGKTIASPIGSELDTSKCKIDPQEDGEGQIVIPSFSVVNIELATTKDVGDGYFQDSSKSVNKSKGPGYEDVKTYIKEKLQEILDDLHEESETQETRNQNPTAKVTKVFPIWTKVQAASESELISSQVNTNQVTHAIKAESNQHENGTESNEFISMESQTKETLHEWLEVVEKVRGLEIPSIAVSPTDSKLIIRPCQRPSDSDIRLHETHSHEIKRSFQEGTTSAFAETIALSTGSKSEHGEGQIVVPCSVINTELATTNDVGVGDIQETSKSTITHFGTKVQAASGSELASSQVNTHQSIHANRVEYNQHENGIESHSHGTKRSFKKGTTSTFAETIAPSASLESGHGEGQTTIAYFAVVNTELATTKHVGVGDIRETSKSMVTHFETNAPENLSQITEDSSFASIVTRELEQLVSNKHLALENLSLLTNFLVKDPSVRLIDDAVSDRNKGFAYTCLAELLKFLQTHSVLDVLGSSHSKFVELLEDVRRFGFNRDWLNDVERCALFRHLQVSEDALQKLLDSKHALIQHLEDLQHELEENEAQVLEVRATLRAPLGY